MSGSDEKNIPPTLLPPPQGGRIKEGGEFIEHRIARRARTGREEKIKQEHI